MPATPSPVTPAVLQFKAGGLPGLWVNRQRFTVCETGFGLGHNFLALWKAWRDDPRRCRRLHYVCFVPDPLSACHLIRYFQEEYTGTERDLGAALAAAWPVPVPGVHRLHFEGGALDLTLFFGEVESMARQLDACVDAFILGRLDSPEGQPVCSRAVLGQLVRVAGPQACLIAEGSSPGLHRALQDQGFLVHEPAASDRRASFTVAQLRPGLGNRAMPCLPEQAVVVGAGIAGASTARALAERGCRVQVFDPALAQGPGAAHRGHWAAAVSPMFNRTDDPRARLSRAAVLRAWQQWQGLDEPARPLVCGTFYPAFSHDDARTRQDAIRSQHLPAEWVRWLQPDQAGSLVGGQWRYGGVWLPYGQRINPARVVAALLNHPNIACVAQAVAALRPAAQERWHAHGTGGNVLASAATVVLCNATGVLPLLETALPGASYPRLQALSAVAGEVYFVDADVWSGPRAVVAGHGYALPANDAVVVVGSTYRRGVSDITLSDSGRLQVMEKMRILLGDQVVTKAWSEPVRQNRPNGWAGWRASVSDRFPVVGELAGSGVWVNACHASRGFSWGALAADVLAAQMFGEPVPLERELRLKMLPR